MQDIWAVTKVAGMNTTHAHCWVAAESCSLMTYWLMLVQLMAFLLKDSCNPRFVFASNSMTRLIDLLTLHKCATSGAFPRRAWSWSTIVSEIPGIGVYNYVMFILMSSIDLLYNGMGVRVYVNSVFYVTITIGRIWSQLLLHCYFHCRARCIPCCSIVVIVT